MLVSSSSFLIRPSSISDVTARKEYINQGLVCRWPGAAVWYELAPTLGIWRRVASVPTDLYKDHSGQRCHPHRKRRCTASGLLECVISVSGFVSVPRLCPLVFQDIPTRRFARIHNFISPLVHGGRETIQCVIK